MFTLIEQITYKGFTCDIYKDEAYGCYSGKVDTYDSVSAPVIMCAGSSLEETILSFERAVNSYLDKRSVERVKCSE